MADMVRRGLLGGALVAGALGVAAKAVAQNAPQSNPDAEKVQQALQSYNDPAALKVIPVGQDWANLHRYRALNDSVKGNPPPRAVFMGDSITDNWAGMAPAWYDRNGYYGRGIGGQVTAQMLVRFMADVVAHKPGAVHILAGTNDLAENTDPYDPAATQNNLTAMIRLAAAHNIKLVVGSVPPATSFAWRPEVGNRAGMIRDLNGWIRDLCAREGHVYADYWPVLATDEGGLKPELGIGGDSVHPNSDGYALMQPIAVAAINAALS